MMRIHYIVLLLGTVYFFSLHPLNAKLFEISNSSIPFPLKIQAMDTIGDLGDDTIPPGPDDPNTKEVANNSRPAARTNALEIFPILLIALLFKLPS